MSIRNHSPLMTQPDDPGDSTTLTPGIVRFVPQPFGRETAAIGSNPVGSIEPQDWGRLRRATWRCALFEGGLAARADTNAKAKIALLHKIADWHDFAGPAYAPLAHLIRLQADEITP